MTSRSVLLVDDEPHVIRVLKLVLEREGFRVEVACNGHEALAEIRRQAPGVLVTDIHMPGMDGRELCIALEQELPQRSFLVLVMTSMAEREHREWTSRMAHVDFLEKPISPRRLLDRLNRHFAANSDMATGHA